MLVGLFETQNYVPSAFIWTRAEHVRKLPITSGLNRIFLFSAVNYFIEQTIIPL